MLVKKPRLRTLLAATLMLSSGVPSVSLANAGGPQPTNAAAQTRSATARAATAAPAAAQQQAAPPGTSLGRVAAGSAVQQTAPAQARPLTLGSAIAGSRVAGAQQAGQGSAPALGSRIAGSTAAQQAGQTAAPALGSRIAGSSLAAAPGAGPRVALGSAIAGTPAGQGSQVAGQRGSRLALGSAIAGSQIAHSSQLAGTTQQRGSALAGSQAVGAARPSGRFALHVPEVQGGVPRVSTSRPGLVLFLRDTSGSMSGEIAGAPGVTKADAASEAMNRTIMEMVLAHQGGDGQPRNRLAFSAVNYGEQVSGGLPGNADHTMLADLANNPAEVIAAQDGSQMPIWVRPAASGGTPMSGALQRAQSVVTRFLGQRGSAVAGADGARRRLVMAFNITDGAATDGDPRSHVTTLATQVRAGGGELLMTNIHISENPSSVPVLFPTEEQAASFDTYGKQLFEMSSPVPAELMPLVRELNPAAATGTAPRMMAVNANLEGLNSVVQAGSSLAMQTAANP